MGRRPKSIEEKLATGNPGRHSLRRIAPAPPAGEIPCPATVAGNPRAKAFWDHYLLTSAPEALRPQDGPLLGELCLAHAVAAEAFEEMQAAGGVVVRAAASGQPLQSPYLAVWNRQLKNIRDYASSLCLTPAERNRVVPRGTPKDAGSVDEFGF